MTRLLHAAARSCTACTDMFGAVWRSGDPIGRTLVAAVALSLLFSYWLQAICLGILAAVTVERYR